MAEMLVNKLAVTQLGSTANGTFLSVEQTAALLATASGGGGGSVGQAFYGSGNGQYTWTCPPGVTSVSVVCIGGGSSSQGATWSAGAGGGGGLGWKNNISVTPGASYVVYVGKAGNGFGSVTSGETSYFISTSVVAGNGASGQSGGGFVGDGGGNGGNGGQYGGGGAGGYTGNGGNPDSAGSGGGSGGGGSYSSTHGGSSGGGTGPFGQGPSGAGGSSGMGGSGGSGGQNGMMGENPWYSYGVAGNREGGMYGGGGAGTGTNSSGGFGYGLNQGGRGCVRIIWGAGRSFPSNGTGDM